MAVLRYFRYRSALRRRERERETAYLRWRRAIHALDDMTTVFGCVSPQCDAARQTWRDTYDEYMRLDHLCTRMRETGEILDG